MRQVTEKEFWDAVRRTPKNVHPTPTGKYPYTSIFYDQSNRAEFGRIVNELIDGKYPEVTTHFLVK